MGTEATVEAAALHDGLITQALHAVVGWHGHGDASDEIYRQEEAQIHPLAARHRGLGSDARQLCLARPPTPIGDRMCCADSARRWDSLTSSTRPFYPARSQ